MAHDTPRTSWHAHLLMLALEEERRAAERGERALATHLKTGTYWHVAMQDFTGSDRRKRISAASRALGKLEGKRPPLVKVERNGAEIRRYFLTPAGRSRAEELLEHGGVSAKTARRKALTPQAKRRRAAARKLTKNRQALEGLLFDMDSPLLDEVIKAPLNQKIEHGGQIYETYGDVPEFQGLWRLIEDPVDRLVFIVFDLANTRHYLRTAKQTRRHYLNAAQHNDAAWPEYRAQLIEQGEDIAPDADWRSLPLHYFLEPPLQWAGIFVVNPLVLAETVDDKAE